jgi:hypothetical protein
MRGDAALPMAMEYPTRVVYEYPGHGTCNPLIMVEPFRRGDIAW